MIARLLSGDSPSICPLLSGASLSRELAQIIAIGSTKHWNGNRSHPPPFCPPALRQGVDSSSKRVLVAKGGVNGYLERPFIT